MKIKRILCPIDFSEYSDAAIKYAAMLAKDGDAELHLIYVYEEPFAYTDEDMSPVPPADLHIDRERLESIQPPTADVRLQREFLVGHAPDMIVAYAQEHDVDLIVMATHGRTGLGRLLMGSVTEAVLRRAPCPTLTVKQPLAESREATDKD